MTKIYRSKTTVSVSVVLSSGKSLHVSFQPLSNGSSVYVTDSEDVQNALERHARYGRLFTLVAARSAAFGGRKAAAVKAEPVRKTTTIKVSDWGAAKDYLADRFGVSRTQLRTRDQMLSCATAHGIVFEGLPQKK